MGNRGRWGGVKRGWSMGSFRQVLFFRETSDLESVLAVFPERFANFGVCAKTHFRAGTDVILVFFPENSMVLGCARERYFGGRGFCKSRC